MQCDILAHGKHQHIWPTAEGSELHVELCEHYCQYCPPEKRNKRWAESKDLIRHLRTNKSHEKIMRDVTLVTKRTLQRR
jgi:hypothetical protein